MTTAENRPRQQSRQSLKKNQISKQIGALMAQGKKEEAEEVKKEVAQNNSKIDELTAKQTELEEKVTEKHAETEEQQKEAVSGTFIPQVLLDIFENKENPFGSPQDSYITRVSSNMADVVLDICGIFIALVISWIIMGVLLKLSGLVAKMPLLGGMNALLGGILGIIYGIIIVFFICLFITLISGTEFGQKIMEAITSSDILSFVYGGALKLEAFILSL